MARPVQIHIGAHKTGTTALQALLAGHPADLAAKGAAYADSGRHGDGHHRLAFAMKAATLPDGSVPDLAEELTGLAAELRARPAEQGLILSSEEFFSAPAAAIHALAATLKGCATRIIATIRRPDTLFCSIYGQLLRQDHAPLRAEPRAFLAEPLRLNADLDFAACLTAWAEPFGSQAVTVLRYEASANAVRPVLQAMGLSPSLAGTDAIRNASPHPRVLEVIRLATIAGLPPAKRQRLVALATALLGPRPGEIPSLLTPEDRHALLATFDPITDAIFARFLRQPNIYHSRNFTPAGFPARTGLSLLDMTRLAAILLD